MACAVDSGINIESKDWLDVRYTGAKPGDSLGEMDGGRWYCGMDACLKIF